MNCGKGQPQQVAPVSHGAVPARFRQIKVLNTAAESGKDIAAATSRPQRGCDSSGANPSWA